MKLKKTIMLSYFAIILIPIVLILSFFAWFTSPELKRRNEKSAMDKIDSYVKLVEKGLINENNIEYYKSTFKQDKNLNIYIYSGGGDLIFNQENFEVKRNDTIDFKNLDEVLEKDNFFIYKNIIKRGENIKAIYEINYKRDFFSNRLFIYILILFFTTFYIRLIYKLISRFVDDRILSRLSILSKSFEKLTTNEDASIKIYENDEIGDLIKKFNVFQKTINEKNAELSKEYQEKNYLQLAINHDLKTPLTSIRAMNELMILNKEYDENRLKSVIDKVDSMKKMLDDLLNYNMLSSKADLDLELVDIDEAWDTISYGYEDIGISSDREIKFYKNLDGEFEINVESIDRALGNLIVNAIKYSIKDSIITVFAFSNKEDLLSKFPFLEGKISTGNKALYIGVVNRAEIIDPSKLEKIKSPFYKLDKARRSTEGLGLGLSIVSIIAQKNNGHFELFQEDGYLCSIIIIDEN
ncbi:HAMP domain-containing sensor histidine kinase [Citroniella saccharovorans]|uniref:histidine kinase n=1 Tax=Citroniella saccharovorans TaxID=2053367 RepID=A0AAW9MZI0_9FIRM|nr:HAMP domain-containing sensor histidine kinase [Citroniella saccharovorans]MEB3429952.1 HAMP domain-containing sensor histidine kinase [Citroniella saccharovorans]